MCQLNWRYLENIFMKAADIRKSLPDETKKFEGIDKSFKTLMAKTVKNPYCLKIVKAVPFRTLDELTANNATLDEIQKSLDDYMTLKRKAFPRFYFLSNDELIDILANSQDIYVIQGHLKTCFDNLVKIDIVDSELIKGMYSNEGEMVPFFRDVKARGLVE
jgi:dynein heavy chain